jgi:hypothetical protein
MATFNDYLVDVSYRIAYHRQRLSKRIQAGAIVNTREVNSLLILCSMYVDLLEFYIDNDESFSDAEITQTCYHLDEILWTKYSTTQADLSTSVPGAPAITDRYYGVISSIPTINDTLIDGLNTDSKDPLNDFYVFSITSPPTKYCILAFPADGNDYSSQMWTDGLISGYYFYRLQSGYSYSHPTGSTVTLDIYISYYKYGLDRQFKINP